MLTRGAIRWSTGPYSGGMAARPSKEELRPGQHVWIQNLWGDDETLQMRGGMTSIPTTTADIGGSTAGCLGLYVWKGDTGRRHVFGVYNRAGANAGLYAVHTSGVTSLGGAIAQSAERVTFAGFPLKCYFGDGLGRLQETDGVSTARVASVDRVAGEKFRPLKVAWRAQQIKSTSTTAGSFPSYMAYVGANSNQAWKPGGWATSGMYCTSVDTGDTPNGGNLLRIRAVGSAAANNDVHYVYGTGGTVAASRVWFYFKSTRAGQYLSLSFGKKGSGATAISDLDINVVETAVWEYKEFDLRSHPWSKRVGLGTARITLSTGVTFQAWMTRIQLDGGLDGHYEYAPVFHRSSDNTQSPIEYIAAVQSQDGEIGRHATYLPPLTTVDSTVDKIRWYRRGEASSEWRLVMETAVGGSAWDMKGDSDSGDIEQGIPYVGPRGKFLYRFGEGRLAIAGGMDHGDQKATLPTASTMLATAAWTAMQKVTIEGVSRGVEIYPYTSGAARVGTFAVLLQKKSGPSWSTQRKVIVGTAGRQWGRWNTLLWSAGGTATKDWKATVGSGVWRLCFSGMAAVSGWKVGCYTATPKKKLSYVHLLDFPARVWHSRRLEPTLFDRLTTLDGTDEDGYWFDLPNAANEPLTAHGSHGSTHLHFTMNQTFLELGNSAADAGVLLISSTIGCQYPETVEEGENHTFFVSGRKGNLRVYAFGPEMEGIDFVSAKGGGFNRISNAIEPILNAHTAPTNLHAVFARGKYWLMFGGGSTQEVVTYDGHSYTGLVFDPLRRSWTALYWDTSSGHRPHLTDRAARFEDTDDILLSGASTRYHTDTNRLWYIDRANQWKDGTAPISYGYETRHVALGSATETRLRGYQLRADKATAGSITIRAYAEGTIAGTNTHTSVTGAGQYTYERRFDMGAMGRIVGLRVTGTASTAMVIRSIDYYLDRKR